MEYVKILIICLFIMPTKILNCFAMDISMDEFEEKALIRSQQPIVYNTCSNDKDLGSCTKYLIRYDGINSTIEWLEILAQPKRDLDEIKSLAKKAAIGLTGVVALGAGMYYTPVTTFLTTLGLSLGLPTVCVAYNEVVEPTGKTLGYATGAVSKIVKYFTKEMAPDNPDKGLIGNAIVTMCGDKTKENHNDGLLDGLSKLIFGEASKESIIEKKKSEIYRKLLSELKSQIKGRKFEDNNCLIIFTDFTDLNNMQAGLKFDKTFLNLRYDKAKEEYFKGLL